MSRKAEIQQVIWSPRFNTFSANLSPDGKEAGQMGTGEEHVSAHVQIP